MAKLFATVIYIVTTGGGDGLLLAVADRLAGALHVGLIYGRPFPGDGNT
jgi:hypothetical protein